MTPQLLWVLLLIFLIGAYIGSGAEDGITAAQLGIGLVAIIFLLLSLTFLLKGLGL